MSILKFIVKWNIFQVNESKDKKIQKISSIFGMLGSCAFFFVISLLASLWSNYNPFYDVYSLLGSENAPYAIFMNIFGFGLLGICLIIFSIGLFKSMERNLFTAIGIILLLLSGLFIILLALFPCDSGCAHTTTIAEFHRIFAILSAVFITCGIIILIYPLKLDKKMKFGWLYFPIELVILILIVIPLNLLPEFPKLMGLMQRIGIGVVLLWIFLISTKLFRLSR